MSAAIYDGHDEFYVAFVDRVTKSQDYEVSLRALFDALGNLADKAVCDIACGEGFLSRIMAEKGAEVCAYDLSERLIETARARSEAHSIHFEVKDAQTLAGVEDDRFDIVVCHLAAMDIPDINRLFSAARRVLKRDGTFALVLLHPCFETPFSGGESIAEADDDGNFRACRVMHYRKEGLWHSGGTGVRGKVGAWHRMLSTYLNALIASGFELQQFIEPLLPEDSYAEFSDQWSMEIPRRLTIICRSRGGSGVT